ncbi:MAG TPA: SPOR domain-containing protein, partial [Rhizomicrobium sp.]
QQQAGSEEDADQQAAAAPPAPSPALALRSQPVETKPVVQAPPTRQTAAPKLAQVTQAAPPPAAPVDRPATQAPAKLLGATPATQAAAQSPVATPARAVAGGAYLLQIGAFKSQSDADAAWNAYQAKHAALLSGFGPDVQRADLGDKGVWYRLRVGSFADKDAAAAMCDRLKAEGAACFPVK